MGFDDINNDVEKPRGGKWLKLYKKEHGVFDYEVVDAEVRNRTDTNDEVVLSRKTGQPRKVWHLVFQTDLREDEDDNGIRMWDANESAQRAISDAVRESGGKFEKGGRLKLGVKEEKERDQAVYQARWTPNTTTPVTAAIEADDAPPF